MYRPPDSAIWKGRVDSLDGESGARLHQVISYVNLTNVLAPRFSEQNHFALLGFCCDEGVKRNLGRPGAKEGPAAIRKAMRNFAVHFDTSHVRVYDAGDVICPGENMEAAQEMLGSKVYQLLKAGFKPIVLGGGHETALGHFLGVNQFVKEKEQHANIINVDAHFDLRKYDKRGNSGTPFLQISELLKSQNRPFNYLVLGINESSNTKALYNTADRLETKWISNVQLQQDKESCEKMIDDFISTNPHTYLSIDLDAIQEAFAPGVSAPGTLGLDPSMLVSLVKRITSSHTVLSMDIVELNPSFDIDNRTARLAAQIIYQVCAE